METNKNVKIGVLHSLIGANDGVSIVIDGMVESMLDHMKIPLDDLYFLAGHSPIRFHCDLDDIFWHKNDQNKYILKHYSNPSPPADLENFIWKEVLYAKQKIEDFINKNKIDLMIVHNSCHPSNFIYAVAIGIYFKELREAGKKTPKYILWWHDSHFERDRFALSNNIIIKFLDYMPGSHADGIVFINTEQVEIAKKYYTQSFKNFDVDSFFENNTIVLPNTCSIPWNWKENLSNNKIYPNHKNFNQSFFCDIGIEEALKNKGYLLDDMALLLQHTRIVRRKRIDLAIDFAFQLGLKIKEKKQRKCVVLLVSGYSGDEHDNYLQELQNYFEKQEKYFSDIDVILNFAQEHILPRREIIVDKKMYQFSEIPEIVSQFGGLGVYFSEVEGYGNNLLEMTSAGLPTVINRYPIYERDIAPLGFELPGILNCNLTKEFESFDSSLMKNIVREGWLLMNDFKKRKQTIKHNLQTLEEKLNHKIIADKLSVLFKNLDL